MLSRMKLFPRMHSIVLFWALLSHGITFAGGVKTLSSSSSSSKLTPLEVSLSSSGGGYDGAPWQEASANTVQSAIESSRYEDFEPTTFSPSGRLYKVEAAVQASKADTPRCNVLIAMQCRDGLVVISTIPTSPFLNTSTALDDQDEETATESLTHSNTHRSSLFLLDETCSGTSTCPLLDIHPCLVAGTGGNAVDGQLLRQYLLALGVSTLENQQINGGSFSVDGDGEYLGGTNVEASVVAKRLANILQEATQKMEADAGLLASTSVILGNRQIWRIDPTGQFWKCYATVVGRDADKTEEELFSRLLMQSSRHHQETNDASTTIRSSFWEIRRHLESLTPDDALDLAKECLQARFAAPSFPDLSSSTSTLDEPPVTPAVPIPQVYWQAIIMDYSSSESTTRPGGRPGKPNRIFRRGAFTPSRKVV